MSIFAEIPLVVFTPGTVSPAANATVYVYQRGTTNLAPIYINEQATAQITQPLITDSQGRIQGWMARGQYEAQISAAGYPQFVEPFDIAPAGDGTIDAAWLGTNSVVTAKISDNAVSAAKIADGAVSGAKIPDGGVAANKLATGAINVSGMFAAGVVNTAALLDAGVTPAKLARQPQAGVSLNANITAPFHDSAGFPWSVEDFDTDNMFDGPGNRRLTVRTAGFYIVALNIFVSGNAVETDARIWRNGTSVAIGATTPAGTHSETQTVFIGPCAVGDYFTAGQWNPSSVSQTLTATSVTWFRAYRLGAS